MRDSHAKDLRKGRVSIPGQIYLVTAVTQGRKQLFVDYQLGRIVVDALRYHSEGGAAESLAFVVMPDHLHWLFALTGTLGLSDLVGSVKGFSSRRITGRGRNAAPTAATVNAHAEPIWQRGFYDHALRRDEDVLDAARYLVMNPVRARIVTKVWDYPLWDAVWIAEA
jgi:putative transposase